MDIHPKLPASLKWQAGCRVHNIFDKDPGSLGRCFLGSDPRTMARIPGGCVCLGRDVVKSSVQGSQWLDVRSLWKTGSTFGLLEHTPENVQPLEPPFLNQQAKVVFFLPLFGGPTFNASGNLKDPRHAGLNMRRGNTWRCGQKPNGH